MIEHHFYLSTSSQEEFSNLLAVWNEEFSLQTKLLPGFVRARLLFRGRESAEKATLVAETVWEVQ